MHQDAVGGGAEGVVWTAWDGAELWWDGAAGAECVCGEQQDHGGGGGGVVCSCGVYLVFASVCEVVLAPPAAASGGRGRAGAVADEVVADARASAARFARAEPDVASGAERGVGESRNRSAPNVRIRRGGFERQVAGVRCVFGGIRTRRERPHAAEMRASLSPRLRGYVVAFSLDMPAV